MNDLKQNVSQQRVTKIFGSYQNTYILILRICINNFMIINLRKPHIIKVNFQGMSQIFNFVSAIKQIDYVRHVFCKLAISEINQISYIMKLNLKGKSQLRSLILMVISICLIIQLKRNKLPTYIQSCLINKTFLCTLDLNIY